MYNQGAHGLIYLAYLDNYRLQFLSVLPYILSLARLSIGDTKIEQTKIQVRK